jgi:hypothetical protein
MTPDQAFEEWWRAYLIKGPLPAQDNVREWARQAWLAALKFSFNMGAKPL